METKIETKRHNQSERIGPKSCEGSITNSLLFPVSA